MVAENLSSHQLIEFQNKGLGFIKTIIRGVTIHIPCDSIRF